MVAPGSRTMIAGSLSSCIAGFHQSCRFSQSSSPRRSCVGTGPAFVATGVGSCRKLRRRDRQHILGQRRDISSKTGRDPSFADLALRRKRRQRCKPSARPRVTEPRWARTCAGWPASREAEADASCSIIFSNRRSRHRRRHAARVASVVPEPVPESRAVARR